jgi:hypothetical protein
VLPANSMAAGFSTMRRSARRFSMAGIPLLEH